MTVWIATILGAVQGLTEFLPISSTAHLRIVGVALLGRSPGTAFIAVTQLGTIAAVLVYFRKDLWRIGFAFLRGLRDSAVRRTAEFRLALCIGFGTIPIGIVGYTFRKQIEGEADLHVIAWALIVLGILLLIADIVGRHKRTIESVTLPDGLAIGAAQTLSLVPGVSRSGATLTAGLFLGFERAAAARFSFLLSVPAVLLSGVFELKGIGDAGGVSAGATAIATLMAFITGYAAIAGLLRYLVRHSTAVFVAYRVALGALVLVLLTRGVLPAN
ncbi:MAG TPA: undecaprenyl-diphosphate phosphatase [Acidimicrobiales bacterium]|nr:undecaprenyl-diphosphate phosphatase [Acidimicrobiales bacterium]